MTSIRAIECSFGKVRMMFGLCDLTPPPQPPQPHRVFSGSTGTTRGLRSAWRRGLGGLLPLRKLGQPINNKSSHVVRAEGSRINIAINREDTIDWGIVESNKHNSLILLRLNDVSYGAPF